MASTEQDVALERYYEQCNKVQYPEGLVRFGIPKCALPLIRNPGPNSPALTDLIPRDEDIYLTGFPKAGTTWMNEAAWLIRNNLDFVKARLLNLKERVSYLSIGVLNSQNGMKLGIKDLTSAYTSITEINRMASPRLLRFHIHLSLLPKDFLDKRIIYITRHPKDVCLSKFHFSVSFHGYTGTLDDFVDAFIDGATLHGPYWIHVREAWARRNEPNFLFLTFEEMKQDLKSVLQKIAKFMDVQLNDTQLQQLMDHLSFEKMKENSSVNNDAYAKRAVRDLGVKQEGTFLRSGTTGKWKTEIPQHLLDKLDVWIKVNGIPGLYEE